LALLARAKLNNHARTPGVNVAQFHFGLLRVLQVVKKHHEGEANELLGVVVVVRIVPVLLGNLLVHSLDVAIRRESFANLN